MATSVCEGMSERQREGGRERDREREGGRERGREREEDGLCVLFEEASFRFDGQEMDAG